MVEKKLDVDDVGEGRCWMMLIMVENVGEGRC